MEKTIKARVRYLLDMEGRKKSILQGGNGKELQEIFCEVSQQIIDLALVDASGNVTLDVGFKGDYKDRVTVDLEYYEPTSYKCAIRGVEKMCYFDEPQTIEKLIEWEIKRIGSVNEKRTILESGLEEKNNELNLEKEKDQRLYEERQKRKEEEKMEQELENKKRHEKEKAYQAEKRSWATQFGSDHLKQAIELGYDCEKIYALERVEKELTGFEIDFDDDWAWDTVDNPSEGAVTETKELREKNYDAQIVTITSSPYDRDFYYREENEYLKEAIAVYNFLGKYYLVKVL